MKLEGTLDAFSLTEIFSLLSLTKKTGTLHLRRESAHGAVHLRGGAVTGARADITRQELGRRLLGSGLADDEALASVAEQLADDPSLSLAALLSAAAGLQDDAVRALAAEQITDAVFSLMRWADGEFSFHVEDADPDDLGVTVALDDVVAEGERRLAGWTDLVAAVPAPVTVLTVNPSPPDAPTASREEWALLALVDGRRTVADLVSLAGQGEYAVVAALAGLVGRGLLVVRTESGDTLARRQALLAALEGRTDEAIAAELAAGGSAAAPAPAPAIAADPLPAVPTPVDRTSGDPTPADPTPGRPTPLDPAPAASTPGDLTPAESTSGEPVPADPTSGEPTPADPSPADPTPAVPEQGRGPDAAPHEAAPGDASRTQSVSLATADGGGDAADLPAPPLWGERPVPALTLASSGHGSTSGATALQPSYDEDAAPGLGSTSLARDPAINRSLLLRLIAGVRGL